MQQSTKLSSRNKRGGTTNQAVWRVRQRSKHMACAAASAPRARPASCSGRRPAAPNRTPSCSWTPPGSSETAWRLLEQTESKRRSNPRRNHLELELPRTTDAYIFGRPRRGPLPGTILVCDWFRVRINQPGGWDFPPRSRRGAAEVEWWSSGWREGALRDLNMEHAEEKGGFVYPCWP